MRIRVDRREVRDDKAFQLPDPDTYEAMVEEIEPIPAKEGKHPSLRVTYKIARGEGTGEQFKDWTFTEVVTLSPNAKWKFCSFFDRLGWNGESVEDIETDDYKNRPIVLRKCKHVESPDQKYTNLVPSGYGKHPRLAEFIGDGSQGQAQAAEPATTVEEPPKPPEPPAKAPATPAKPANSGVKPAASKPAKKLL